MHSAENIAICIFYVSGISEAAACTVLLPDAVRSCEASQQAVSDREWTLCQAAATAHTAATQSKTFKPSTQNPEQLRSANLPVFP